MIEIGRTSELRQVQVHLCDRCGSILRNIRDQFGEEAMAAAAGEIISQCVDCRSQLPTTKPIQTELKREPIR